MTSANKNGIVLEKMIHNVLKTYKDIGIQQQYFINDIFGKSKVDFRVDYKGKTFFIEAKNQTVKGSVDQKLPFYIENIRENKYPGHFVFVINGDGIRNGAVSYLKKKQLEMDFSIIDFNNIQVQMKNLLEHHKKQTIVDKIYPIIKWAGGKRLVMKDIKNLFPLKIHGDYYEPFCGGFSVACELYNTGRFSDKTVVYLNDNIPELITLYEIIKTNPSGLIEELNNEKYAVNKANFETNKERYNTRNGTDCPVELAALFLFLNKSGFNGIYRVNKEGKYNIPYCKKEGIVLYEAENIYNIHNFLQNCVITCKDYSEVILNTQPEDVVYFDPPYLGTFNGYSKNKFDVDDHVSLVNLCYSLKSKVYVSNSEAAKYLYNENCIVHEIPVKRVINSKTEDRSKNVKEIFVNVQRCFCIKYRLNNPDEEGYMDCSRCSGEACDMFLFGGL